MNHIRIMRLLFLALAIQMLVPAASVYASLMAVTYPEVIDLEWVGTESTPVRAPAQEAPADKKPNLWNLFVGLTCSTESRNGDAGGLFSRAHNYNGGFEGFGLVTEFGVSVIPEPATLLAWAMFAGMGIACGPRRRQSSK